MNNKDVAKWIKKNGYRMDDGEVWRPFKDYWFAAYHSKDDKMYLITVALMTFSAAIEVLECKEYEVITTPNPGK